MNKLEDGGRASSDPASFFLSSSFDPLVLESVIRRLHEIAFSDRITSNEAQWLIRARNLLELLLQQLIQEGRDA